MDQDATTIDELKARREAMRERLRAKCEKIVEAVEAMPEPKTFLEAERVARAILLADKMVLQVFSEPKAVTPESAKTAKQGLSKSQRAPVDRSVDAPIVTSSPFRLRRVTSPLHTAENSYVKGEDEMDEVDDNLDEDIDIEAETPLSKTYLKLEQIAAKIADLDAEFNAKLGP